MEAFLAETAPLRVSRAAREASAPPMRRRRRVFSQPQRRRSAPIRCCANAGRGGGERDGGVGGDGVVDGDGATGLGSRFVFGFPENTLRWCLAETEMRDGLLMATPMDPSCTSGVVNELDGATLEECGLPAEDIPHCQERIESRSVTPYFVDTFRMSSVYISVFRDTTFVIHLPGALAEEALFESLMRDIALLAIVGIRLVVVLGAKFQIDRRVAEARPRIEEHFIGDTRVTDARMLRLIKEATGALLFEVESKLARGVTNNLPPRSKLAVVSGNLYSAQPLGVLDGHDYGFTGKVRRIDVEAIERRLQQRDIVVLTNIAYSPSGEAFNCQSEHVASACAAQLRAEKLIYLGGKEMVYDRRNGSMVPNLPLKTARQFLSAHADTLPLPFRRRLQQCVRALDAGVRRAHVLNRFVDGVLLMEVFHRDGVGIMISRDLYEGVRSARLSDLPGIFEIIEPLEAQGVLVRRSREQLEKDVGSIFVAERDGMVIALAMLETFADDASVAELSCFAVHPRYRRSGKGGSLLNYVERVAYASGRRRLFLLSTQSFAWFRERNFVEADVRVLPPSRQARLNHSRRSKVLCKELAETDELEELLIQVLDSADAGDSAARPTARRIAGGDTS